MACGCQKAPAKRYQYVDPKGEVHQGTQLEMRARQIRDQREQGRAGVLTAVEKQPV